VYGERIEHAFEIVRIGADGGVAPAAGLGLLERSYQRADTPLLAKTSLIAGNAVAPRDAQWFSPLR